MAFGDLANGFGLMNESAARLQAEAVRTQAANAARDAHYAELDAASWKKNAKAWEENSQIKGAGKAGVIAQRDALRAALAAIDPNHPLLRVNGLDNKGNKIGPLQDIYYKAFDAEFSKTHGGHSKGFRTYRVK